MNLPILSVFLFICGFGGAFLQSGIGFGAGVLMVNIIQILLPPVQSIIISQCACTTLAICILRKKLHSVRWDVVVPMLIPAVIFAVIGTFVSSRFSVSTMKMLLGILFMLLSVYFSFMAGRIKVTPTLGFGLAMGTTSGLMNGLFGMGGPPAVLYLAPALEDKTEYIASCQVFFMTTNTISLSLRLILGSYCASDIFPAVFAMLGAVAGAFTGLKLLGRLNGTLLKRFVYAFIGINGAIIVINQMA